MLMEYLLTQQTAEAAFKQEAQGQSDEHGGQSGPVSWT